MKRYNKFKNYINSGGAINIAFFLIILELLLLGIIHYNLPTYTKNLYYPLMILPVLAMFFMMKQREYGERKRGQEFRKQLEKIRKNAGTDDSSPKGLWHIAGGWHELTRNEIEDYIRLQKGLPLLNRKKVEFLFLEGKNK